MLPLIRFLFRFGGRIAPKSTGKVAFRLFCTPLKPKKKSANHRAVLASGEALYASATLHKVKYSGGTIAAHEFQPHHAEPVQLASTAATARNTSSKTVYVLHGWQSNAWLMANFVEPLQTTGWRVICIDSPGHGLSSGRQFHLPLAVSGLHAVADALGPCDAMITHSLGGAVAATAIAGTVIHYPPMPVQKLVLISSPNSMPKIFDDFCHMVNLNEAAKASLFSMVETLSGRTVDHFTVASQLKSTAEDLLLIHAPDDKEVPFSEAEAIAACKPNVAIERAQGLGHRRIIASDDVVKKAVEFIQLETPG